MWCVGLLFGLGGSFLFILVFYYYFSNLLKKLPSSSKWAEGAKPGLCEMPFAAQVRSPLETLG